MTQEFTKTANMENKAIATLQDPGNLATLMKVAKWYNPEMPDHALEARVMQEVGYFDYACLLNDNLSTCDPRSIMMMVRWVIQNNLSIDTQAGLVYLKTRNVKQSDGSFIKVLEYEPSPEGVLSISYSTGEIIDHQRPVIYYSGEEKPRVVGVDFSFQLSTGRWETVSYAEGHFRKWRLASHENNARGSSDGDMVKMNKANKSYTSFNGGIDPEFCTGKAIKHGLDKRGTNRIAPKRAITQGQPLPAPTVMYKLEAPASDPHTIASPFTNPALGEPYIALTGTPMAAPIEDTTTTPEPIALTLEQEQAKAEAELHQPDSYTWTPEAAPAPVAQSAIPLDFAPDPIHAFLANCSTMADLGNLFSANKEKVLASDTLKAEFKKREQEINEKRIAAESAAKATPAPPVATPKITANDL